MDISKKVSDAIIKASCHTDKSKLNALNLALKSEEELGNENAVWALNQIIENIKIANKKKLPLCDDTGIPHIIIEMGKDRQISSELINQIYEGIDIGLEKLPGRPMAVRGNDIERIEQNIGLYNNPSAIKAAPILLDTYNDKSTYKRDINDDALNIHFLLQGGGPEIRANTYRVFHKRSSQEIINNITSWLSKSLNKLGCTPSVVSVGIGRTHYEANALMIKSMIYGNLDKQSNIEKKINNKLNKLNIGPLGLKGLTTVLGSFVNIGFQRASGVRVVAVRPSCFVEPRKSFISL